MVRHSSTRGFTLVELMIVVAIIGVLAALAIYGVGRYFASAKTAEAKESIGAISRAAVRAFESEVVDAQLLSDASDSTAGKRILCGSAVPVPNAMAQVAGRKYQPSSTADFQTGTNTVGWRCLRYEHTAPIAYRYTYFVGSGYISAALGGPNPGPNGFEAAAQSDLDGDGQVSTFARAGMVQGDSLRLSTEIFIDNEFE